MHLIYKLLTYVLTQVLCCFFFLNFCVWPLFSFYFILFSCIAEIHLSLIFQLNRNAQPVEKLKDAYRKFFARSMRKPNATDVCMWLFVNDLIFDITFIQTIYYSIYPNIRKIQWRSVYQHGVLELSSLGETIVSSISLICLLEFLLSKTLSNGAGMHTTENSDLVKKNLKPNRWACGVIYFNIP